MKIKLISCFALILISFTIYSQSSFKPFNVSSALQPAELSSIVENALILDPDFSSFQNIVNLHRERLSLELPLSQSLNVRVDLKKQEVLTHDAKIVAGTDRGDKEIHIADKFVSYMGTVRGVKNSFVSVTFFKDFSTAIVSIENETYVVGQLSGKDEYIIYNTSKLKAKHDFKCGSETMEIPQKIKELQKSLNPQVRDYSTSTLLKATMAIESDYDTYLHYGSVENASRYLISLMASVSAVYIKEVNVQLSIGYLRVWSTSNDPYNGTTSGALLNEFRAYWNSNMQSVNRTLAHYITTRPGGLGGIAWVNVLCSSPNSGYGYAFSDIDGTFNILPVYSWDVDVVSHETGHNFGSPHTHNCSWAGGPIDTCYIPVEGGCYNGPAIPRVGTIMSYCHLNAGKTLIFGPQPQTLIRTDAENAGCITAGANFIVAMPNGGEIFRSGLNTLIIWGTSITGTVNIEYSTDNGSTWNTILNNVPAVQRNINWTLPYIPTTTLAKVRVYETGNTSNGDASDSVFQIRPSLKSFNMQSPVQLSRMNTSPSDTSTLYFIWTRAGSLPEIKYRWTMTKQDNTFMMNQFSGNGGNDSILGIRINRIDSLLAAFGVAVNDSIRVKWFVDAFTQLDSLHSASGSFLLTFIRQVVGIKPLGNEIPKVYYIDQNYPNPFNPETNINFGLPKSSDVKLTLFNIQGREIDELVNSKLEAGKYSVNWNASNYASGVYFYRIESGNFKDVKKMVLIK
jgi:hypothetical protein